jgi:hypothetical protein
LRLGDHRLLHGRCAPRSVDEPYGFVARERAGPNSILNFRQHNARGDPSWIGEGLSAKHPRGCAGRAGHDGEQVAHPIEDHDRDAMRCAKAQGLDAHKSIPAGHDDGGGHSRPGVVSQAAFAVIDKERAALDTEAGVVGLRSNDARLDRKARVPENVGLSICGGVAGVRSGPNGRRRLMQSRGPRLKSRLPGLGRSHTSVERVAWSGIALDAGDRPGDSQMAKPFMSAQINLKSRPRVWAGGRRSIVLIGHKRRCLAIADSCNDRRRVEWITSRTPHGSPICTASIVACVPTRISHRDRGRDWFPD